MIGPLTKHRSLTLVTCNVCISQQHSRRDTDMQWWFVLQESEVITGRIQSDGWCSGAFGFMARIAGAIVTQGTLQAQSNQAAVHPRDTRAHNSSAVEADW